MPRSQAPAKLVNRGPAGLLTKTAAVPEAPTDERQRHLNIIAQGKKNNIPKALEHLIVPIASLTTDPNNARVHPERNMEAIMESLALYGQTTALTVRKKGRVVMAGNGRLEAAKRLGWDKIAAVILDFDDVKAAGYGLADNRSAELARWDFETVARLERLLADAGHESVGWSAEELAVLRQTSWAPPEDDTPKASLADRFLVPPFSVLDARQGYWQERKRAWLALGILSELGRGVNLLEMSETALQPDAKKRAAGKLARTEGSGGPGELAAELKGRKATAIPGGGTGQNSGYMFRTPGGYRPLKDLQEEDRVKSLNINTADPVRRKIAEGDLNGGMCAGQTGTSIFDPVLCELAYRWFCPAKGRVLDPFAGGSVRGIVAAKLGRGYLGVDLRPEQATANEEQAARITPGADLQWVVGDSKHLPKLVKGKKGFDFLFSCPPYADLERYSDDPRDISTMPYQDFLETYRQIIEASAKLLAEDRFACFVVGDVRDRATGCYRNFVGDTVAAFRDAGLELYNDAVLVTAVGSLPIRVGRQFAGYRKLGKTHQNVLVFVKGDPARASEACGEVDMSDLEQVFQGIDPEGEGFSDASL